MRLADEPDDTTNPTDPQRREDEVRPDDADEDAPPEAFVDASVLASHARAIAEAEPLDAGARRVGSGEVHTRSSLSRGRSVRPGFQIVPYVWPDLVDGRPPRRRGRRSGAFAVMEGIESDDRTRVTYTAVVRAEGDDLIIDNRLDLQRRALQEVIERVRGRTDILASRARTGLNGSLVQQRRAVNGLPSWFVWLGIRVFRFEARFGHALINAVRALVRLTVLVPDIIITQATTAYFQLSTRTGRNAVRQALTDPKRATNIEKGVAIAMLGTGLVIAILLLNTLFSLVFINQAAAYRALLGDFIASIASVLALPLPSEPLLILRILQLGPFLAMTGLLAGKVVGSWILYLIGDALFDSLNKQTSSRPRLRRLVDWMQRNADQHGFTLLIIINGVPFMPDVLVMAFAVSGMRFKPYISGLALGTFLKFLGTIIAVLILGQDVVATFLEHPIQTIRG